MAKLDFRALKRPTLEIVMNDEAGTLLRLTTPREELIEKLQAALPELEKVCARGDADSIRAVYDLAADLMSNNLTRVAVTADDLRGKYNIGLEDLIVFFSAYLDFIAEITNAKN